MFMHNGPSENGLLRPLFYAREIVAADIEPVQLATAVFLHLLCRTTFSASFLRGKSILQGINSSLARADRCVRIICTPRVSCVSRFILPRSAIRWIVACCLSPESRSKFISSHL